MACSSVCAASAVTLPSRKTEISILCKIWSPTVPSIVCTKRKLPSSTIVTVTVPTAVICIVALRVKFRATSPRKKRTLPQSMCSPLEEVETALLVGNHAPVFETDHPAAHAVDHRLIVRRHDHRGAFEV